MYRRFNFNLISRCGCDDNHLVIFQQRSAGIVDNAVGRGNPFLDLHGIVEDSGHGDGFEMHVVVLTHQGYLRAVLLEDQRSGWYSEDLPIDRSCETDCGVGAGTQRPVLVVNLVDRDGRTRADVEPTSDGQKLSGEMTIGELWHRHVGRQAWLEKGPERLRHADEEAQLSDLGHGKEVPDSARITLSRARFFIDVVPNVDVANGHHAIKGCDDRLEPDQCLEVLDILLRGADSRRLGFRLLDLYRDRLFRDRLVLAHIQVAFRGQVSQDILGTLGFQISLGLGILGVESRRVDFSKDIALRYLRAVILVPHLHIASDLCVNLCLIPGLNVARQRNRLVRRQQLWIYYGHPLDRAVNRFLLQNCRIDSADIETVTEIGHAQDNCQNRQASPTQTIHIRLAPFGECSAGYRSWRTCRAQNTG